MCKNESKFQIREETFFQRYKTKPLNLNKDPDSIFIKIKDPDSIH